MPTAEKDEGSVVPLLFDLTDTLRIGRLWCEAVFCDDVRKDIGFGSIGL